MAAKRRLIFWLVTLGLLALFIGAVNVKDFFAFGRGISLSIPEKAKPGIYQVVCIEPAANGGKFSVEDPDGIRVEVNHVPGRGHLEKA